jgi:predicted AlkP superfamily pyrophosphatase or phosphodiesterase
MLADVFHNAMQTMLGYRLDVMRKVILLLIVLLAGPLLGQTTRPVPGIERVLIISIDGCRPDLLLRAETPVIHGLLPKASFSFWARTTAESVTLPSHVSMLTGVTPVRHGIQWNADLPLERPIYPEYPTLFQLAKQAGYSTGMVAGKAKFSTLAVPDSLDWEFVPFHAKSEDPVEAQQAVAMIHEHRPQVLFVHFPSVDNAGHSKGWASAEQMAALAQVDGCVGQILGALAEEKLSDSTMVIITADHGGAGLSHGPDDPRSRHIPWIVFGPRVRKNLDLTTFGNLVIDTEDTFATACYVLGIPIVRGVDGKAVLQIFQRDELLRGN